jgi:hypothetical protein
MEVITLGMELMKDPTAAWFNELSLGTMKTASENEHQSSPLEMLVQWEPLVPFWPW